MPHLGLPMAAAAEPLLMTVEQYRELKSPENVRQELHWGQIVTLTFPKMGHTRLQRRLLDLLRACAGDAGVVAMEVPFRAVPEYDLRAADVAFVSQQRWNAAEEEDNLHGAPELVVGILSPSNTAGEMREKAALCLVNGAEEFWVVDPKRKIVMVTRRGEETRMFGLDGQIPLRMFGREISVRDIFEV